MTYPTYSKSELSTLAVDAYQCGFRDSQYSDKIDVKLLEDTADDCADRFERRKLNNTLNTIPESYKEELARYLVADTMRKLALERLSVVFWSQFNAYVRSNMLKEATDLAINLPPSPLRMKAFGCLPKEQVSK